MALPADFRGTNRATWTAWIRDVMGADAVDAAVVNGAAARISVPAGASAPGTLSPQAAGGHNPCATLFRDGLRLCTLVSAVTGQDVTPTYEAPKYYVQKSSNVKKALEVLTREQCPISFVSAEDVVSGNELAIFRLCAACAEHYPSAARAARVAAAACAQLPPTLHACVAILVKGDLRGAFDAFPGAKTPADEVFVSPAAGGVAMGLGSAKSFRTVSMAALMSRSQSTLKLTTGQRDQLKRLEVDVSTLTLDKKILQSRVSALSESLEKTEGERDTARTNEAAARDELTTRTAALAALTTEHDRVLFDMESLRTGLVSMQQQTEMLRGERKKLARELKGEREARVAAERQVERHDAEVSDRVEGLQDEVTQWKTRGNQYREQKHSLLMQMEGLREEKQRVEKELARAHIIIQKLEGVVDKHERSSTTDTVEKQRIIDKLEERCKRLEERVEQLRADNLDLEKKAAAALFDQDTLAAKMNSHFLTAGTKITHLQAEATVQLEEARKRMHEKQDECDKLREQLEHMQHDMDVAHVAHNKDTRKLRKELKRANHERKKLKTLAMKGGRKASVVDEELKMIGELERQRDTAERYAAEVHRLKEALSAALEEVEELKEVNEDNERLARIVNSVSKRVLLEDELHRAHEMERFRRESKRLNSQLRWLQQSQGRMEEEIQLLRAENEKYSLIEKSNRNAERLAREVADLREENKKMRVRLTEYEVKGDLHTATATQHEAMRREQRLTLMAEVHRLQKYVKKVMSLHKDKVLVAVDSVGSSMGSSVGSVGADGMDVEQQPGGGGKSAKAERRRSKRVAAGAVRVKGPAGELLLSVPLSPQEHMEGLATERILLEVEVEDEVKQLKARVEELTAANEELREGVARADDLQRKLKAQQQAMALTKRDVAQLRKKLRTVEALNKQLEAKD